MIDPTTDLITDAATFDGFREGAQQLLPATIELRREIHRHPELGTDNPETQRRILRALDGLGLDVSTGSSVTSVTADLVVDPGAPTILLRADTDALPMLEESGEEFSSTVDGQGHMCGHDAHVAMLIGAAKLLVDRRDDLPGNVRFIFQPGEEGFGGAVNMIDEGALDGIDAAFAIHVTPNVPAGFVAAKGGPLMAATDDFVVTIRGRGAHASTPHFGNDPIPVACEIVTALQTFVTRRVEAFNPAVITVGRISAGSTSNVIPETAELMGTIRTVSEHTRAGVRLGFERIVTNIAAAHECTAEISLVAGYPVTVNDDPFTRFVADVTDRALGEPRFFELPTPVMGAEDFSYILQKVPGAMAFLGVCPTDIANSLDAPSCHSNLMRINEDAMASGVALHAAVAWDWLANAGR